jgi:radical SAM protein with 4Fe4S-binding SPASM domain
LTAKRAAWAFELGLRLVGITARRPLVGPMRVSLEITHHCNLRCSFCESHGSLVGAPITDRRTYVGGRRTMSIETIEALCRSLAEARVCRLELSGKGEPMAHPEFEEVVRIIKRAGLIGSLVTNGTLAKPGIAASLVEARFDRLNVSLNAATAEVHRRITGVDVWEPTIGFVREVIERRRASGSAEPWARVSYVLCKDNLEDVGRMVDLGSKLGLNDISWAVMGELPETAHLQLDEDDISSLLAAIPDYGRRLDAAGVRHNFPRVASELRLRAGGQREQENPLQRGLPCYDGWMFTVIGPDGTVVPCCPCENVRLGNINEQSFSEIWRGEQYREFRRRSIAMPKTGKPVCWECFASCNRAEDNARIHRWLGPLGP